MRLFAVFLILVVACVGWVVLGGSIELRTNSSDMNGWEQVGSLWGTPQTQQAPTLSAENDAAELVSSDITADIALEQRKKGLLWYATYVVDFDATYGVRNSAKEARSVTMFLPFPAADGVYDGFAMVADGHELPVAYKDGTARATFTVPAGETVQVNTGYRTQGQDEWRYAPTQGVGVIDDFSLTMTTDFSDIDFPNDAVSPTEKNATDSGWTLSWDYESLVSGRSIGIIMPVPLNPGPIASRISFFAPVSLLFYFAALVLLMATRQLKVHPMNFAFLAAGFFAFHLLFAYLVDRADIYVSFGTAAVVSVGLCVSYLSLALSDRRAVLEAAVAQFIFLILFSFSFFFEGFTGLAITIGAVLTLAYFMFRTARIDWNAVFERSAEERNRQRGYPTGVAGGGTPPLPTTSATPATPAS